MCKSSVAIGVMFKQRFQNVKVVDNDFTFCRVLNDNLFFNVVIGINLHEPSKNFTNFNLTYPECSANLATNFTYNAKT